METAGYSEVDKARDPTEFERRLDQARENLRRIWAEDKKRGSTTALSYIDFEVDEVDYGQIIIIHAFNRQHGGDGGSERESYLLGELEGRRYVVYERSDLDVVTGELALEPVFALFDRVEGWDGYRPRFWTLGGREVKEGQNDERGTGSCGGS